MKPKSKARPADGVGGVPLMKHEYLKRDIIHQHMVSHYRRLYNAKCDVDTSTPLYFKPRYKPKPKPILPVPTVPVQSRLSKSEQKYITNVAGDWDRSWNTGNSRLAKQPMEEKEWIESVLMSIETETGPIPDRDRSDFPLMHEMKQIGRSMSLSMASESPKQRNLTAHGIMKQLEKSISEDMCQREARHYSQDRQKQILKQSSHLFESDIKKDSGISSKIRDMNVYHPPRRRMPSRDTRSSRRYCSRCLAKVNKMSISDYDNRGNLSRFHIYDRHSILDSQKEELKYVQFIQDITQDVLSNDIYSNEGLNQIFTKHIKLNKGRLEMSKMKKEVHKLKIQLDVPDVSVTENERSVLTSCEEPVATMSNRENGENDKYVGGGLEGNFFDNQMNNMDRVTDIPHTVLCHPYQRDRCKAKRAHEKFITQKFIPNQNFKSGREFENKLVKKDLSNQKCEVVNTVKCSQSVNSKKANIKADTNICDSKLQKNPDNQDENKVISLLQNMGFDLSMAEEICQCMSDKELSNFKFPYEETEDKHSAEEDLNMHLQSGDHITKPNEDSNVKVQSSLSKCQYPIQPDKINLVDSAGDYEMHESETAETKDQLESIESNNPHMVPASSSEYKVENKSIDEDDNENSDDSDNGKRQGQKSNRNNEENTVNRVDIEHSSKCIENYETNDRNHTHISNPFVTSPVASDYSSMKDHDESVYDYSAGEEPDEGRESGSEIEEEISEQLSVESSSSGISQLAERLKNFNVDNMPLHNYSPEKWNMISSEKTFKRNIIKRRSLK